MELEQTGLVLIETVEIELELHTRSTARFSMVTEITQGVFYRPLIGESIRIEFEGTTIFAGTIENLSANQQQRVDDKLFVDIEAVSWEQICDRKLVADAYTNQSMNAIILDVWVDHLQEDGITIAEVDAGPTIEQAVWNYETVTQVFNDLAGLSGSVWWIDVDKGLHFVAEGTTVAPFALNDGSQFFQASFSRERSDYRNRQFVRAGNDKTDPRTEKFKGDGETKAFTLTFPVGAAPTSIKVNSVEKTFGVRNVEETDTKDWFFALGDDKITQSDDGTALTTSDTLEVTYQGLFPLLVISQDAVEISGRKIIEGGSGIYDAVEDKESIDEAQFAFDVANRLLKQKGIIPDRLQFTTRKKGLRPAQLLTVQWPPFGLNEEMLIERIAFREIGSEPLEFFYDVTAISGQALGGWAEFFMKLSAAGKKFRHRENEVAGPLKLFPELVEVSDSMTPTQDGTPCLIIDVDEIGLAQICS